MQSERRIKDLESAIIGISDLVEHLVVANPKIKTGERASLLAQVDTVRALATPESAEDPDDEPDPPASVVFGMPVVESLDVPPGTVIVRQPIGYDLPRFQIDTPQGEAIHTNDIERVLLHVDNGAAVHAYDRKTSRMLVHNFRETGAFAELVAEYHIASAA